MLFSALVERMCSSPNEEHFDKGYRVKVVQVNLLDLLLVPLAGTLAYRCNRTSSCVWLWVLLAIIFSKFYIIQFLARKLWFKDKYCPI